MSAVETQTVEWECKLFFSFLCSYITVQVIYSQNETIQKIYHSMRGGNVEDSRDVAGRDVLLVVLHELLNDA
jgi:hypothetical protein